MCHSVTKNVTALRLFFSFFLRIIIARGKPFLPLESPFDALQHWFQGHSILRLSFAGNWSLSDSTKNVGAFFVTALRDYKPFLKSRCFNRKISILYCKQNFSSCIEWRLNELSSYHSFRDISKIVCQKCHSVTFGQADICL